MIEEPSSISKIFQDALHSTQNRTEPLAHLQLESLRRNERDARHEAYLQWRLDQFRQPR